MFPWEVLYLEELQKGVEDDSETLLAENALNSTYDLDESLISQKALF